MSEGTRRFAGRYELLGTLGEGGMSVVHRARHAFTGREVALKVLKGGFIESEAHAHRFLREARAPAAIDHPALVEVLDAGVEESGSLYLALELLRGEDLARALDAGRVDTAELVRIARELLSVLAAAHAAGMVHRDVKPANVFLEEAPGGGPPRVRLLDLGLVRGLAGEHGTVTRTGAVLGTPAFMSPEQLRGERADPRTDLWAVGAILYAALAGRPPYAIGDRIEVIAALTREPDPLGWIRPDLPAALCAAVDRALRRDPLERPASAADMDAALSCALPAGPTTPVGRTVQAPPTGRGSDRRWVVLGFLGATALVPIAGLVIVLALPPRGPTSTAGPGPAASAVPAAPPIAPEQAADPPPPPSDEVPARERPRPEPRARQQPRAESGRAAAEATPPAPFPPAPPRPPADPPRDEFAERHQCRMDCSTRHALCVVEARRDATGTEHCTRGVAICQQECTNR